MPWGARITERSLKHWERMDQEGIVDNLIMKKMIVVEDEKITRQVTGL